MYHRKHELPVVVFRPTCIYGPFGRMWTIRPIKEIKKGATALVNGGKGIANIVYIDNLIDAVFLAIEKDNAIGEAFIINDNEYITWADFYQYYSDMLSDHPLLQSISLNEIESIKRRKKYNEFKKSIIFPLEFCKAIAGSPEVIEEIQKVSWIRLLANKLPARFKDKIKKWTKSKEDASYTENFSSNGNDLVQIPDNSLIKLYASKARFSNNKLKEVLGWEQRIEFKEAMELTKEWLKYQRLI